MIELINTEQAARFLIKELKKADDIVPVFDLDGVIFDASHRIPLNADGSINLEKYRVNSTLENIMADKLLPLAAVLQFCNLTARPYHVATARVVCAGTQLLFDKYNIKPQKIISRQGEEDTREDWLLKTDGFLNCFDPLELKTLALIDDNLHNVSAALLLGLKAVKVARCTLG